MTKPTFNVSYARWNDREALAGGTNRHGMEAQDVCLRDAINAAQQIASSHSEYRGACPSDYSMRDAKTSQARWVSFDYSEYESGDDVTASIHFPDNTTPSSRARLVRLLMSR